MKTSCLSLGFIFSVALAASADTFPITFAEPGYIAGSLNGQGAGETRWIASPSSPESLSIESGIGPDGRNALITTSAPVNQAFLFPTSETDLPGFDGGSSRVDFRFRFRLNGPPNSGKSSNIIVQIGYEPTLRFSAVRIGLSNRGGVTYQDGTEIKQAKDADGGFLLVEDTETWVEVAGQIDYGTKTYTISVNGVPQGDHPLAFGVPSGSCTLRLINIFTEGEPHVPTVFDLFSLTLAND